MKKCTKCARTYDDGVRFCPSCGNALSETAAERPVNLNRGHTARFDSQRARNRTVLMVTLLNVIVLAAFSCGLLWMTFRTVQGTLHDESINQMLIYTDGMGVRGRRCCVFGRVGLRC